MEGLLFGRRLLVEVAEGLAGAKYEEEEEAAATGDVRSLGSLPLLLLLLLPSSLKGLMVALPGEVADRDDDAVAAVAK